MLDIAEELHRWFTEGRDLAVATVVAVEGSAPRPPGAALAVDRAGEVIGSVSGGCVEGAVHALCRQALEDGRTVRERFGHEGGGNGNDAEGDDGDPLAVGLTCGGVLDVLVVP
ncbi:XdhC family protein, partial [Streptomyces sp. ECR3]